jgi:stearoyl-CoA desaturase (delta-9 desaturase)
MNMFTNKGAVPGAVGRVRFDPVRSLWLWTVGLSGAAAGLPALDGRLLGVSLGLTFLTLCLGHSVGLHRGIIHRSYEAHPAVRGALAWLFVLSGLGGPLSWARLHAVRDYWQNREGCPPYFAYDHGLLRDFFWNLHTRFEPADDRALARLPAGLLEDRWLRFLERTWPLHVLALAAGIGAWLGPGGLAVCVCLRTAGGLLGHWFVGYAAHVWGERRYRIAGARESGTNLGLLGIASFGEGFHNNHHAFPWSARMGLGRGQLDLGWLSLRALEAAGLVRSLRAAQLIEQLDEPEEKRTFKAWAPGEPRAGGGRGTGTEGRTPAGALIGRLGMKGPRGRRTGMRPLPRERRRAAARRPSPPREITFSGGRRRGSRTASPTDPWS